MSEQTFLRGNRWITLSELLKLKKKSKVKETTKEVKNK